MKVTNTLIVLACVCSVVIVWCIRYPKDSALLDETLASNDKAPAAIIESPRTPEREQVELPPEPAPIAEALEATPPVVSDSERANALYSVKYAKATLHELVVARYDLDNTVATERDRIFKEILASGDLNTTIVRPGDEMPSIGTKKGGPPVITSWSTLEAPLADGSRVFKYRIIEPEKYPEFHALEMEAWWVTSEVRHRERLAK